MQKPLVVPFLAALVGGVVVAAGFVALGVGGGETKTVVQQSSISPQAVSEGTKALTARDIYKRDAPGVVNVKSEIVQRTQPPFGFPQDQQGEPTGSGFVVHPQGATLPKPHATAGPARAPAPLEATQTDH